MTAAVGRRSAVRLRVRKRHAACFPHLGQGECLILVDAGSHQPGLHGIEGMFEGGLGRVKCLNRDGRVAARCRCSRTDHDGGQLSGYGRGNPVMEFVGLIDDHYIMFRKHG